MATGTAPAAPAPTGGAPTGGAPTGGATTPGAAPVIPDTDKRVNKPRALLNVPAARPR